MDSLLPDHPHAHPISTALRDEILEELAGIAADIANDQWDDLTTRLADALLGAAQASTSPQETLLCVSGASLLKKNRYPFYYVASERLATVLHHEIQAAQHPAAVAGEAAGVFRALPPELEVDKKLSLIKAGRAIEAEHNTRMNALNIRLAFLFGGDTLSPTHNPFRPQVFLSVIHDAWCEFQPHTEAHHLVYPLLGPDLCLDMAPILHALNGCLIKRGIVPHIAATDLSAVPNETAPADDILLTQKLRQLFHPDFVAVNGDFSALFREEAVPPTAACNALIDYLAHQPHMTVEAMSGGAADRAPQCGSLEQLWREAPTGARSHADDKAFELLTKIFGTIQGDPHIADEMKAIIAQLQLPLLKAVLFDRNFFFKQCHPARRVIELMARLALDWDRSKGPSDPLYALFQRSVAAIREETGRGTTVFADVACDLESFIKRDDTALIQALADPIAEALQEEAMLEAAKTAKNDVALRVCTSEVAAFVETFLENKWVQVLTLAYSLKSEKPRAGESAVKTMDDLCWSVKPKITMPERKELLAKLPGIIAMLNKWLDAIKWNDDERVTFFAELAACHASIVRAPLELSPERQMQIALAVARKAAERRRERQEWQPPEAEPDAFDHMVERLERGIWVEFLDDDGSSVKVKLAWVSPMRNFYLFATTERKKALSMSAEALAQSFRVKRARVISLSGMVNGVLASALSIACPDTKSLQAQAGACEVIKSETGRRPRTG
jgi:hypothetical protein